MLTCIRCGRALPWGAKYCAYCGARQPGRIAQIRRRVDWVFLGRWLAVTALAWAVAWLVLTNPLVESISADPLARAALAGLMIAAGQWLVLWTRPAKVRRKPRLQGWLAAVPAGWLLAALVWSAWPAAPEQRTALFEAGRRAVPALLMGVTAGLAQWPVARHFAWPARGWLIVPGAACAVALAASGMAPQLGAAGQFGHATFGLAQSGLAGPADFWLAGICGGLIGLGQLPLVWRTVWGRWFWPAASAAGFVAGAAAADGILALAGMAAAEAAGPAAVVAAPLAAGLAWGAGAAGMAGGQWLLVRLSPPIPGRAAQAEGAARLWVPLAVAGWAAGGAGAWFLVGAGWLLLGAASAGFLAGLPLWLAAPRSARGAIWLPIAGAGAWVVVAAAAPLIGIAGQGLSIELMLVLTAVLGVAPGGVLALDR